MSFDHGPSQIVVVYEMKEALETFVQRARVAKEDRDRYTVDNGKICRCPECGAEHYKRQSGEPVEEVLEGQ